MKRVTLWVCAALMGVLAMGLCSCNYLDDLKDRRLELQFEPGTANVTALVGKDHTYTPILTDTNLDFFPGLRTYAYVVEGDVPLLLQEEFGLTVPTGADGKLVMLGSALYASDEMTPAEIEAVKQVKLDRYVMQGWWDETGQFVWKTLDADITAAIRATLAGYAYNGEPSDSDIPRAGWKEFDTSDSFFAVDEQMVFMGSELQFSIYDTGQIFLMDWREYAFYVVPEQYHAVVMDFYRNASDKGGGMVPLPVAVPER